MNCVHQACCCTLTLTSCGLQDPNTKTALFESADIIKYLNETYATSA